MDMNREFLKEELKMAKKLFNMLSNYEIQIKITLRFHFVPVRMAKIVKITDRKCY